MKKYTSRGFTLLGSQIIGQMPTTDRSGMTAFNQSKTRGFTLIELLVVIAIIGILSSVVLASLSTARAKSRDARRIADLDQVRTALELYNDSNGAYPNNGSGAAGLQAFDSTTGTTNGAGALSPTFMGKLPGDPIVGGKYYYCPQVARGDASCSGSTAVASSTFYMLGANLERTDSSALKTDADVASGAMAPNTFQGLGTKGCNGAASGNAVGVSGSTETCYDITP